MLQVRENEISLRSCVIHNDVSEAGSDPASKFRGGAISVIFCSQVSLRVHYCKRDVVCFTTLL